MFRLSNLLLFALFIAARLSLLAEDQVIGYAPEEPLFVNLQYPTGLKEDDLKALPLDDPKLRIAYVFLIRTARSGPKITDERTPEMMAVLNDLKRRSDAATPLLLDIMAKNHNTRYEHLIPLIISRIGTIKMASYLDYLREMVRTRPDEISAAANEAMAELFLEHGSPDDVKMMQDLGKKRPFLAPSLERAFDLHGYKKPNPSNLAQTTPATEAAASGAAKSTEESIRGKAYGIDTKREPASSTPWSIIVVLIVAAGGLLWLLLKRRW